MSDRMLKWSILGLVLLGLVTGLGAAVRAAMDDGRADAPRAYADGAMKKFRFAETTRLAPSATFRNAQGESASLADYRGRVVLMNLWATWCPPCLEELPALAALRGALEGRPFALVTVSVDREGPEHAARFMDNLGLGLPEWNDKSLGVAFEAQARGFPTTVLYGPDGREIGRVEASADWASPDALKLIEAALAGEFGPAAAEG